MERVFTQEIYEFAVYPPRAQLVKYLVFFFVCDLLWVALLFFFLFLASGFPFVRPSPDPSLMRAVQIFMAVLSLPALFLVIWLSSFALFTMRRLVSHKPTLLITHQGITFQDLPVTGSTFLSWSEVASLSTYRRSSSTYLCLNPKEKIQFLSRFRLLRRFFVILGSRATGTLIHVPHWFLSEPVGKILLQIQETFQDRLRAHEVQVFGSHSEKEFR